MNRKPRIRVKAVEITVGQTDAKRAVGSGRHIQFSDRTGRLWLQIALIGSSPGDDGELRDAAAVGLVRLVVGDPTEPGVTDDARACSNAVLVDVDLLNGHVHARTSVVGLPPLFCCTTAQFTAVSCPFLPHLKSLNPKPDVDGIADT